ncbi:MAG: TIGR04283 family arsenosugar biosynthesis glycosyltransferase, partial [Thermodesulfobacteriota bacterium]
IEVIVSDGGSTDRTVTLAERAGARVVSCAPGRGEQMDRAAAEAHGEVLLFLHADTRLPEGWRLHIERALSDRRVVAGAFTLKIDSPSPWFRVVEFVARQRARYFGLVFGDQALFVRKDLFLSIGGFRGLPLMEDVDCVKRLRSAGVVAMLGESVFTSPRRWTSGGAAKNTLKNWLFLLLYRAGVTPARLYRWYYR